MLLAFAEMVDNFEMRYKVDDEKMRHERSVLEVKKLERIVLELWLEGLEDAVFNMEDLVFKIHTEALQHKLDGQICKEMEDIRCSLESYAKAGNLLGLAGQLDNRMNLQIWRNLGQGYQPLERERQLLDKSEEFGRDYDKEEIIKLLLSDDANDRRLLIISITGNGRIEKTTLARFVYNEQRVSHHFDSKAWVNVPDDFSWVTKSILKELRQYVDLSKLDLDQIEFELQNLLKGKRFLLVLDGEKQIPSSERKEALQPAFKFAAKGSRIIATARKKVIASMKYAVRTYCMEPLSEEKCWLIFAKFAFGDQNPTSDTQLEVVGKEIV